MSNIKEVSILRLYLLRAGYLLLVAGLGYAIWPELLHHDATWPLMRGVVVSMLAAMSILAALGIRYPLRMLPVLLFELAWKAIWLLAVALPSWSAHRMTAGTTEMTAECLIAAVLLVLLPWRYLFDNYLSHPTDPWWRPAAPPDQPRL
jgi:hypothetical protein